MPVQEIVLTIKKNGEWYNFELIPQGYIKICNLACGSDKKAIKQAEKICTIKAKFEIVEN
ncbi:MAG TPA: hypothetical protein VLA08_06940 [Nitrosopumilus sp.]|nr:hypothetical protein [Nitrosopumilus sp.]